jgi:homoserine O-acetyltransferase/O-succinyltransferase
MPINEDMFFPPRDCAAEQALIPNSEFRVVDDVLGHLALFGVAPTYMPQIDRHLWELLATPV